MRTFHCDHCEKTVFFENTSCGNCGHRLTYLPDLKFIASLDATGKSDANGQLFSTPDGRSKDRLYRLCRNYSAHNVCNWAVPSDDHSPLCISCRLTQVIPDIKDEKNRRAWSRLESAKRRLVYSLAGFELPLASRTVDAAGGLAFHFKGDPVGGPRVLTGHESGIITLNIDEADDVKREKRRVSMHEPYRTLLGHFRHEIGHYYWDCLIKTSPRLAAYRKLFGDERTDYNTALKSHYANGPSPRWNEQFISAYASVHPWEDWAESWAHYMHMTDTLETAAACGLSLQPDRADEPAMKKQPVKSAHRQEFSEIIANWFPLTYALNGLNRGMGLPDAYPFVLPPAAIDKLRFVHETICAGASAAQVAKSVNT